jgi:hypothetical protein
LKARKNGRNDGDYRIIDSDEKSIHISIPWTEFETAMEKAYK